MSDKLAEIKERIAISHPEGDRFPTEWLVWSVAEIERLRADLRGMTKQRDEQVRRKREGRPLIRTATFEEAAKMLPVEPAGLREGDRSYRAGWERGVLDFRAAIRAKAKEVGDE